MRAWHVVLEGRDDNSHIGPPGEAGREHRGHRLVGFDGGDRDATIGERERGLSRTGADLQRLVNSAGGEINDVGDQLGRVTRPHSLVFGGHTAERSRPVLP